jgi:hypothetical protein
MGVLNMAKARVATDGSFLGAVSIALKRDYLAAFYSRLRVPPSLNLHRSH